MNRQASEDMAVERIIPDELSPNDSLLAEHLERYGLAASLLQPEDVVVDTACGVGYGSAILAKKCRYVYSYDNSAEAIDYALKHYHSDNIEFALLDLDRDPLPECDVLVSFETIEHLRHPGVFLEKAKSKARRLILLSTPIIPTKHLNPFHLHDFSEDLVEELMRPWQPAYFCVQYGSSTYGVWIFTGELLTKEEQYRLLLLNLQHQRSQSLWLQKRFEQLWEGKVWLEEQWRVWQKVAEEREKMIQEQQAWIGELERGKAWLEEQVANWQAEAERRAVTIAELERGKAWLEEQWRSWQESTWGRLGVRLGVLKCSDLGSCESDRFKPHPDEEGPGR